MFVSTIRLEDTKSRRSWRLFQATDVASLMYPNILISLCLGFFPFKYKPGAFVFSKSRFVVSLITQIIYVCGVCFSLYNLNVNLEDRTVELMDMNFFLVSEGLMLLVVYALSYQKFILLGKLTKLSRMLSQQDFCDMAKFVHTKDIIGLILVLSHLPNCYFGLNLVTVSTLTIMYVLTVYFAIDMNYVNCVYVIRACFIKINEHLKKLNVQEQPSLSTVSPQRGQSFLLLMKLKHYEQLHQDTSDVIRYLNKAFLLRIIMASIVTFTVVTFNLYFAILWYGAGIWMSLHKRIWYIPYLGAAMYYMGKFSMMVWVCESAMNRDMEIGTTIHESLNTCTDNAVRRELRYFALQVLHRENTFTSKAIAMNGKLLSQIISGIVMYILILFQFLLNYVACNSDGQDQDK
ncbi:uncharacterized protein LOC143211467 [Lasioglossum baleicum]|uniref:uncharacterized protein LOC143211467 n=1 Tax=Lasioglossum baleicum TaxID=434251 RepID=UPI003FCDC683